MSLTGAPLLVLAVLGTAAALTATVAVWPRRWPARHLLRSAGVLLTEALLLLTVGLAVNRSEQFYPTWDALAQAGVAANTFATEPGQLDRWLRSRDGDRLDRGVPFSWRPGGWTGWRLAGAPTVVVPAGYLSHTGLRYPTLLVIDDGSAGWTPAIEDTAARAALEDAGPAVVIYARTTPATSAGVLTSAIPMTLARDLRVTGRRWALVAAASDGRLGRQAVAAAPALFPTIALVGRTAAPGPESTAASPVTVAVTTRQSGGPAEAANSLEAALVWACEQTPPPLAASTPAATYVPRSHPARHGHRRGPAAASISPGGTGAAGQPGR